MAKKNKNKQINVIAYLSTNGNMYSAPVKEKKQLHYLRDYAKAHNIRIIKVMNRDIAINRDIIRHFRKMAAYIKTGQADGVIVANLSVISESLPDAYYKVGIIAEAKGSFITVDEGNLSLSDKGV
mgnify:CR=1 FL=1